MSLALCPQVVSALCPQVALRHFRSSELLCPPVYLLGHFPSLRQVQGNTPTGIFVGGCRPLTHSSLGFPFHFLLSSSFISVYLSLYFLYIYIFFSKLFESVRLIACGKTVTSSDNPAESMDDCFHRHYQAGGCTVFMDGSRTLLDSEAIPWLVFVDRTISVHYEVLRFVVFLNDWELAWSLTLFCLLAILGNAFPSFLAGVRVS